MKEGPVRRVDAVISQRRATKTIMEIACILECGHRTTIRERLGKGGKLPFGSAQSAPCKQCLWENKTS